MSAAPLTDQTRYPDIAATHHLSFDHSNLNLHADDYVGHDQWKWCRVWTLVTLELLIYFLLPKSFTKSFACVINLEQFIICQRLSRFTRDNNVSFEFHPNFV
jgi:hypothetical protein